MKKADKTRLRYELAEERGYSCEWCGRSANQLHHCLIHGRKPDWYCKENLMLSCADCHTVQKVLDTDEVKRWFWAVQCSRYGEAEMLAWLGKVNEGLVIKYNFI